jgi:hypothetical protein
MAGMGMEPLQLDRDVCAWRTEGSGRAVAMAGSVTLRADGQPLVPERSFSLRWVWRWRSVAGQVLELDRLVTVARSDRLADAWLRVSESMYVPYDEKLKIIPQDDSFLDREPLGLPKHTARTLPTPAFLAPAQYLQKAGDQTGRRGISYVPVRRCVLLRGEER